MDNNKKVNIRERLRRAVQSEDLEKNFESVALQVFEYQYCNNPIYQKYVNLLNVEIASISSLPDIPFLPISFFKSHRIQTGQLNSPSTIFRSSGTEGQVPAQHFVSDLEWYTANTLRGFKSAFSFPLEEIYFLALLPSYLERSDASLVYMAKDFAKHAQPLPEHFFLNDFNGLFRTLKQVLQGNRKTVLLGVTFALLDFAQRFPGDYSGLTIIETGGMKGQGPEWVRPALHQELKEKLKGATISSEYGMTELMSQAYWREGYFKVAPTMRVYPRDITDPLAKAEWGQTAALNIVDLANIDSCSFIASSDLGRVKNGSQWFEVLGRMDHAEIRGCNLMYSPG